MARKTDTVQVGDRTFQIRQMPVRRANRLLLLIGEMMASTGGELSVDMDMTKLVPLFRGDGLDRLIDLLLDDGEGERLAKVKAGEAWIPLSAKLYDDIFSGAGLLLQIPFLAAALRTNVADFLGASGQVAEAMMTQFPELKAFLASQKSPTSGSGPSS